MAQAKAGGFLAEDSVKSFRTEERRVIFASSLGTVFEWYDFYLYAVLAPFFAVLFFPPGNQTAALLSAFAAYAAGFLVRPFGALLFGRIGDLVGRKYTFLITIVVMGASTFAVGLLPTYETLGWAAPILMVSLREGTGVEEVVQWVRQQLASRRKTSAFRPKGGFTGFAQKVGLSDPLPLRGSPPFRGGECTR